MASSVSVQFCEALLANLQDASLHPALNGVQIVDGPPQANTIQLGEWVMLGDVHGTQEFAVIDVVNKPKNEIFTVDVLIDCIGNTYSDQKTLNDRCIVLWAEVENELRARPQQGIFAVLWAETASENLIKRAEATWRESALHGTIKVKARL